MIFEKLQTSGQKQSEVRVRISNELVQLLSDQLYQSPLKAIEELVVNAYDAGAKICRLFVPNSSELAQETARKFLVVFDNGSGLSATGMVDLWHVGRSNKRTEEVKRRAARKQNGKFGIGKLATYTIANNLTYISKTSDGVLTASMDFSKFKSDPSGAAEQPIDVPVLNLDDWAAFSQDASMRQALTAASGADPAPSGSVSYAMRATPGVRQSPRPAAYAQRSGCGTRGFLLSAQTLKRRPAAQCNDCVEKCLQLRTFRRRDGQILVSKYSISIPRLRVVVSASAYPENLSEMV